MHQIALFPRSRQGKLDRQQQPQAPEPPPLNPDFAALLAKIEEKALRREFLNSKNTASGVRSKLPVCNGPGAVDPLVSNSISEHTPFPLPPWSYVPSTKTTYYHVYNRDVYICRSFPSVPPADTDKGTRAAIFEFSDKSRSNLRHVCNNSGHLIKSQFCLTYHESWPTDGKQVKDHLRQWLRILRRLLPEIPYLWVLEFQTKRGSPHFHVFLGTEQDQKTQKALAQAWVEITGGTESQYKFHNHPKNWITWKMDDASYVMKQYAAKQEQKEVPEQYHNVGRFWGHSHNMQPIGTIVEPAAVVRFTLPGTFQWDENGITRFFDRTLRRYHEKSMNYDRKTGQKRKGKKKKSPITRAQAEIPGAFRIPFAAPLVNQLMNYVAENGPDLGTIRRYVNDQLPF